MNKTLFKATFKSNRILMLIICLVLLMYTSIIISMFDPEKSNAISEMMKSFPEGIGAAFGFDVVATDLTTHIGSYLYGFVFIMFPMIYSIVASNSVVAKHVDTGSMAYLLSTPNTRVKIVSTQAVFLIFSISIIFVIETLLGIIVSESIFKGLLETNKYIMLNLVTMLVFYAVSGIGFFFSCIFNEVRYSLAFGAGVPIAFLLFKMLSGTNEELEWIKYLSIYSFIDVNKIYTDSSFTIIASICLLAIAGVFYTTGILLFNKRSLSI